MGHDGGLACLESASAARYLAALAPPRRSYFGTAWKAIVRGQPISFREDAGCPGLPIGRSNTILSFAYSVARFNATRPAPRFRGVDPLGIHAVQDTETAPFLADEVVDEPSARR